jgi:hypothetical protein
MFKEMHHADHIVRAMDLAEKMAERRRQSLATTGKSSLRARLTRMLFAVGVSTGSPQTEGRA